MTISMDSPPKPQSNNFQDRRKRLVYAFVFAVLYNILPWPQIWERFTGRPMWDRSIYIRQIEENDLIFDHAAYESLLEYITNEFLWGFLLRNSYTHGFSAEFLLDSIGFLFILISSIIIATSLPLPFLLLLINPLIVGLAFSQSRIALMMCILYAAYFVAKRNRLIALLLVLIAPAIHTSAPLFLLLYFLSIRGVRKKSPNRSPIAPIFAGVLVSALSGPLMPVVLGLIEDRRAGGYDMSSGFLFLSIWILGVIYLIRVWPSIRNDRYSSVALAVMSLAASSILFDSYASRFIAVLFPVCVVALSQNYKMTKRIDIIVIALFAYTVLSVIGFVL